MLVSRVFQTRFKTGYRDFRLCRFLLTCFQSSVFRFFRFMNQVKFYSKNNCLQLIFLLSEHLRYARFLQRRFIKSYIQINFWTF